MMTAMLTMIVQKLLLLVRQSRVIRENAGHDLFASYHWCPCKTAAKAWGAPSTAGSDILFFARTGMTRVGSGHS